MAAVFTTVSQVGSNIVAGATPLVLLFILVVGAYCVLVQGHIRRLLLPKLSEYHQQIARSYLLFIALSISLVILIWYVNTYVQFFPHTLSPFILICLIVSILYGWRLSLLLLLIVVPLLNIYDLGPATLTHRVVEFYASGSLFISSLVGIFLRRYLTTLGSQVNVSRELLWKTRKRLAQKTEDEEVLKTINQAALSLESSGITFKGLLRIIVHECRTLITASSAGIISTDTKDPEVCEIINGSFATGTKRKKFSKNFCELIDVLPKKDYEHDVMLIEHTMLAKHGLGEFGFQSMLLIPLHAVERRLFIFVARDEAVESFTEKDRNKLQLYAAHVDLAIRNAQHHEELAELLVARDKFSSAISHELKTPLTTIKLYAQLLVEQAQHGAKIDKVVEGLKTIDQETDKLALLVNSIHDFARIQSGRFVIEKKQFNLLEVCQNRIEVFPVLYPDHHFRLESSLTVAPTFGDPLRLEQVITNLLSNAAKYSPNGSTVSLALELINDSYRLTVKDEGQGIAKDELKQVFEPFYRSKKLAGATSAKGLGLGLYIAKGIIELHNGTIEIMSQEGKGTKVVVQLPQSEN